jgi:chaperonin cofactor prefoldin
MEWHLTESRTGSDTDELPVLSEEAILLFEAPPPPKRASKKAAKTRRKKATPKKAAKAAKKTTRKKESKAPEAAPAAEDSLVASVETLRAALETAEKRWHTLETQLQSQDHAIAELRTALERPETAEPVPQQPASAPPGPTPAATDLETPRAPPEPDDAADDRELLERVAALEIYIAGRADRWREMEHEVEAKTARIAELESELAQRIVREQQLEERLHHEGGRSVALRDKLRRMRRRIEQASRDNGSLDATTELIGPAGELRSIGLAATQRPGRNESSDVPELVCLSSDMRERYRMNKDAITIGRAPECDIQIATDFVSRQHATIRREDREMVIEDESSTNGVYVNAVRVQRQALADGDEITIGESRFRFVRSPAQQELS